MVLVLELLVRLFELVAQRRVRGVHEIGFRHVMQLVVVL